MLFQQILLKKPFEPTGRVLSIVNIVERKIVRVVKEKRFCVVLDYDTPKTALDTQLFLRLPADLISVRFEE